MHTASTSIWFWTSIFIFAQSREQTMHHYYVCTVLKNQQCRYKSSPFTNTFLSAILASHINFTNNIELVNSRSWQSLWTRPLPETNNPSYPEDNETWLNFLCINLALFDNKMFHFSYSMQNRPKTTNTHLTGLAVNAIWPIWRISLPPH